MGEGDGGNANAGNAEHQLGMKDMSMENMGMEDTESRSESQCRVGVGAEHQGQCRAGARRSQLGWYSRGYLPHCDHPGLLQSITYRLADSLPRDVLARMEDELRLVDPRRVDTQRRLKVEAWLDAGHGGCVLRNARAAACVVDNWRHFAGERYDLIAWVVMPNHVHVLIRVYEGIMLGKIVQSWKSYTGRRIKDWMGTPSTNSALVDDQGSEKSRAGARRSQVWQREYWDRFIRNERHFNTVVEYIHQNPVKAGLVDQAEQWEWSSANKGNA